MEHAGMEEAWPGGKHLKNDFVLMHISLHLCIFILETM